MRNYWKAYRTFADRLYRVFTLLVIPAALLVYHYVMTSFLGPINIINTSIFHMFILGGADYFTFNGITAKGYGFGMLRCSLRGKKHLRDSLYMDYILRMVYVAFINIASGAISYYLCPQDFTMDYVMLHITFLFATYAVVTTVLILVRNFTSFTTYAPILGVALSAFCVAIIFGVCLPFMYGHVVFWPWIVGAVLLAIASTIGTTCIILRNYHRSFQERIRS